MPLLDEDVSRKAQIALEFVVVYSFVLIVFVLMFTLIAGQRASTLAQQEYSTLQLQAQNVASYIDQALGAGNGYAATIPFSGGINAQSYNLSISTTGVIIAQMKVGTQILRAYAFSNARSMIINGTQTQSGNGITVYLIPIQRGSLFLANSNGAIYIDTPPASTLPLAKSVTLTSIANTKVANFNGASSYINIPFSAIIDSGSQYTVSAWIQTTSSSTQLIYSASATGTLGYQIYVKGGDLYIQAGGGNDYPSTKIVNDGKWHNVVGVWYASGAYYLYADGVQVLSGSVGGSIADTAASQIGEQNEAGTNLYFNGQISNVQLYSTTLTPSQIWQLYQEGIGGTPILPASTVGWWPLNGNSNDYSGNNNNGAATSVVYPSVVQINTQVTTGTGANAVSTLIGAVTSNGVLGANGNSIVLYTNATGSDSFFVTSNGLKGVANLTINTFNDNITTVGNLIGWWPLDEGYGSAVYDLSGYYNNGAFTNPSWASFTNSTNLAAANFNGASSYISIPNNANLHFSGRFTVSAWIYETATQSGVDPMIIGDYNGGYQGYKFEAASTALFEVGRSSDSTVEEVSSSQTLVPGTWYHIVGVYNGTAPIVYVNGIATVGTPYSPIQPEASGTTIGKAQWYSAYFTGIIANIQLYKGALTSSQVKQLYTEGISGSPIGDVGLAGWWPLAYSANDYSTNGNNGVATNVGFNNVNYNAPITSGATKVANFNGQNNYIKLNQINQEAGTNSISFTVWFDANSLPTAYPMIFGDTMGSPRNGYDLFVAGPGSGLPSYLYMERFHAGVETGDSSYPPLSLNTWYFAAVTYNGISLNLYLDGVLAGEIRDTSSITPDSIMSLGATSGTSYFGNYQISDFQIYNNALTPAQIQQMYQQGLPQYSKMNVSLG
jgi:hypothetical protein